MARKFFFVCGGIFFLTATLVAVLSLPTVWGAARHQDDRIVAMGLSEAGVMAITADGTTYAGGGGKWKPFGSIRSGVLGVH